MATKDRTGGLTVAKRPEADSTDQLIEPFTQLRSEMDRLFDRLPFRLSGLDLGQPAAIVPAVEMTATDKLYKITAELPGMTADDIEVSFDEGVLRIAGEKKAFREENERGYRLSERSYGTFERLLALPSAANPDKVRAKFKDGVLTVTVAKDGAPKNARVITIDTES